VSAWGSWWLASAIPMGELIFTKCYFFLDTVFLGFYTFVNCKVSLAGSMSTRQRENRKNGNQESSSKEASEEGSQENSKEEVSSQRNRQHNRGTPKASPDVFLGNAFSLVFMRLRRPLVTGFPDLRLESFRRGCAPLTVSAGNGMAKRTEPRGLGAGASRGKEAKRSGPGRAYAYQSGTGP
jgi:hypothetical protein